MLDLIIRNGVVVDGSGAPGYRADVGVKDGRIAEIGTLREPAAQVVDAEGQVVSPGFIDVHTHYDAQIFWDPTLSPSCYHGVTSVFAGNCGFSIAPLSKEAAPYLLRMLARVEGMPEAALREGVPWDWKSFGQYLAKLEGRAGLNIGFMCGHSAIRRVVMGERAVGHVATPEDLSRMETLLAASLREGAMGFSSTVSPTHNDAEGEPVPSRYADRSELITLARVCRDFPGTVLEIIPGVDAFGEREMSLMSDMSLAANRAINWNVLSVTPGNEALVEAQLKATEYANSRGGKVVPLTLASPATVRLNFHSGFLLDMLDGWTDVFKLPLKERIALLSNADKRQELDRRGRGEGVMRRFGAWEGYVVTDSGDKSLNGRTIADLAQAQGKTAIDAILDLAIKDDLRTVFTLPSVHQDQATWERRAALWRDERTVVGASDAGAHLDMLDTFGFSTQLLANSRDHELLSLEEAVRQLTEVPANLMGLKGRGRLKIGYQADLVVFNPRTVGSSAPYVRNDLPGGEMRLYGDAIGVDRVIVNGVTIVEGGTHTGALPGVVLKSGRDTETNTVIAEAA